ncbi:MAG: tripartite tricarboxylate transporter substrate binding protein [Burkholderiales bacterium]|nr:tripartite tricarboxylate transporter substrate binding protein [Burkholderiales bacterium]
MKSIAIGMGAAALLAVLAGNCLAQSGAAAAYPARPIRIIVPNSAGSATDTATRIIAQRLTDSLGQQTVIDNRAGASGVIGHEITTKASPDGYTLLVSTSAGIVINPILKKVPYRPEHDFTPISLLVISPQMLFSYPGLPVRTVDELVALARAKPGQLNCASPGFGTSNHLGCEMLKTMTGVNFLHVPYKATSPAVSDVVGGQVQFMFNSMPNVMPLVKVGKLRGLALAGVKRSPSAPDLPLMSETIPGFQCITWYALFGPAGMPGAIVTRLNGEIVKMFADTAFAKRISDAGQEPQATTPEGLTKHMREESARWSNVIKAAGLKLEG